MKKILIIDDDRDFSRLLIGLLSKKYKIFAAYDGEEGLLKTNEIKPDLIILDLKMPKMNGIEFLKKIQTGNQTGELPIPILIVSNLDDTEKISEGIALGVRGYIIKSEENFLTIEQDIDRILL
ncbi:hypothetical protein A3B05_01360 [Candidatus Giovannonibacteria bacterium RIFCSPLOWO2_01_FULL_43_160]|uniref:ATPase/histidine kinase/DNA gyrase B/HSP90 domain protein n=2 Tax=Candidatus Giovannoniibacteriota TaxID=1752738 RepID=A0A0G1LUC6_9BACT|nr:MAG: ATPase/histidine kinase/DNA gyrase B/HSP90 domain protein [Candidatus Giovannonibacteria bacterium GW2011_GWB1_43_13]KKS99335.1 MAG: ATPase/histidine kinase/DNA gyrase B/HSP90 domain protein [Candidatus Giovannonibacteria bacterium GW2011_GWA1_43_15]KKT21722.1 MAG: ATPase/histidine kinase/DNA gyrase B/HSP90 domain protein [Candidatus Giovannonibacteria bacterium GW2011_GWC2_43_8]KKT63309.1 MAG: ATPase/histidine kinase/DNA gyrase B/HSP90 domain protein [Candidatus Giovannonibacteria bacte